MAHDFRQWIEKLEGEGELKRIKARVDWRGELAQIVRRVYAERGPALIFEDIEGYENTRSTKLFTFGMGSRGRTALMLGMSKETRWRELVKITRKRFKESIEPISVDTGPVKENIVKGDDINIFDFPVPQWHPEDGGRYINTFAGVVTRDPDTGDLNVGIYRGQMLDKTRIATLLIASQHWGVHYSKYKEMNRSMPVAMVYGWDPAMQFVAGTPLPSEREYDIMGAVRQEPVPLVKCETSDLQVPASAEIVIEGSISPDPETYELEGPFGEWPGYYSEIRRRPVIEVQCITHRSDPIYQGTLTNAGGWPTIAYTALFWNVLEAAGIPGIVDIVPMPILIVKIHKTFRGQPRAIAAALWGSQLSRNYARTVMVVEDDVNIHDHRDLRWAFHNWVDAKDDLVVFPGMPTTTLEPGATLEEWDVEEYGTGSQNKLLIDATVNWNTHPRRKEWGGKRHPGSCADGLPEEVELVNKRWKEYGL